MKTKWMEIKDIIINSNNKIKLEEIENNEGELLNQVGVNVDSVLGQILLNVSKLKINNYLRILGGRRDKEDNIVLFNDKVKSILQGNKLIIAYDIWGGIFSINNGDFEGNKRNIWYFAPDLLQWEDLDINYSQFISWACSDNINKFYSNFVWNDMQIFLSDIKDDQAVLIYPFLWSNECTIETAEKKIVPITELISINADYQKRISD